MNTEIPLLKDILPAEMEDRMICAECGFGWLEHSFHGNFCPVKRREPKTTFLEMPKGVN